MTAALSASSLGYRYPGGGGFRDLSFAASAGEVSCIFGLNGSGKTTLLRVLSTLITPQGGDYHVCGIDAVGDRGAARKKIFPVFDSNAHFDHLTGRENLHLFTSLYGRPPADAADATAARFGLDLDRRVGEYSLGMRRKLSLLEAFASGRECLFFDEPALGLDSSSRSAFFTMASEAAGRGAAVVFCTNRIDDTLHAGRLWRLEGGRLGTAASTAELSEGLLQVRIAFHDHEDVSRVIPSLQDLPDAIRSCLPLGRPRTITVSGGGEGELWSEEAKRLIGRAPRGLQKMITALVERHARDAGYSRITEEVVNEVRRRFEQR